MRNLLKSKKAETRKLSELSKTKQNRLVKLNGMLDELRLGENVQNRRLATWLTEDEYESFESDWESQLQIREELNDNPDELKRYEDKLKKVIFNYSRVESYSTKGKHSTAKKFYNSSESLCEDALEILQEIGAVSSESEFSKDWLCRSEYYLRTLRFKCVKPSVGTLAICASKLQCYGRCMTATEAHSQLGNRFIELSERCHTQINTDAVGWWKDEVRI